MSRSIPRIDESSVLTLQYFETGELVDNCCCGFIPIMFDIAVFVTELVAIIISIATSKVEFDEKLVWVALFVACAKTSPMSQFLIQANVFSRWGGLVPAGSMQQPAGTLG